MAVIGALLKKAIGGYGKKPKVPDYTPVDPTAEQASAIAGNLANLPEAQKLAEKSNLFNIGQLQKMLRSIMPGYDGIQAKQGQLVQDQLSGNIPKDVQDAVQRSAAAQALGGGYAGSGAHRNLVARDFGMTSYQMTQQGMDSATRWMAMSAQMAQPLMMDATSMFLSPQQRIAYSFQNRENQFNTQWMKNQIKAAPDPWRAALGDAFIEDERQMMEMVGSVAGMAGMMCWVAREVYGEEDSTWRVFRHWLLRFAPAWFRELYRNYGERFANWIKDKPLVKRMVRWWMDGKIKEVAWHYSIPLAS
jgi:hypothetical protein